MASNPWLAGVNVSKCPVCDVRLLNGSCIDHGPTAAEEVEDWPEDPDEPAESEKPEEPQSQKKMRKKMIVDTDSKDTPASSSADKQTEQPPKADEALH